MTTIFSRLAGRWAKVGAALAVGLPLVHGASMYMSVVAETFGPDAATFVAGQGKAVTYTAVDGGFINAGDPVGGTEPPAASVIDSAIAQALAERGYQPAATGTAPAIFIVYNWGEIRHDSFQVQPTNHLKGNDRARLLLVARTADAERIERDIVDDRLTRSGVAAMTRTEPDREAIQLSHDELAFVVVSAYDAAALRQHNRRLVWQVKLTTRAIGRPVGDSITTLIHYGAAYFGRNESARKDMKQDVVPAATIRVASPIAGLNEPMADADPALVQNLVQTEHAQWSGKFPND